MNDKSGATMSSSHPQHRIPHVTVAILIALLALALAPGSTFAGPSPVANPGPVSIEQAVEAQPPTVTIPANSAVEIAAFGHCLERGEPFPGATLIPAGLAPDDVRVAIGYSVAQGYAQNDVWQPQLAVWTLTDGQQPSSSNRIAREIVEYASSGRQPADVGLSTQSVVDAVNDGSVDATVVNFASVTNPDYFGAGALVLTNLTAEDQVVHIPYGMRFIDPNSDDNQDIAVFPGGSQPGPEGPAGPQGPAGADGATGPMGPAGADGADGADGATGPMDATGPAGADGEDGATGPMGPASADGADGETGPMGATGPAGADGADGATGPMGPAGADGADGETGPMGPAGTDGATGATGATGPQGPAGAPGISCWDMNMNGVADDDEDINGDGVHDTWDCEGEDGPMGPTGPTGATGPAGADGATGPAGPAGADGATGPIGPASADSANGEDGATGPMGPTGATGSVGPMGPAGADGATGPAGPAGADGATGPIGPAGADSANGEDGATGPMGPTGATGSVGPMGPAGPAGPQGSPGLVGVTMVMDMTPFNSEPTKEIEAVCPAGTSLISGGANVEGPASDDWFVTIEESYPSAVDTWHVRAEAWYARIARTADCGCDDDDWKVTAWALCAELAEPMVMGK